MEESKEIQEFMKEVQNIEAENKKEKIMTAKN
jgi:hypothetical protein